MSFLRYIIGRKRFLGFWGIEIYRLRLGVIFRPAMGPARATAVSTLDFEPKPASQNTSCGVMAKAITPLPQRVKITPSWRLDCLFNSIVSLLY